MANLPDHQLLTLKNGFPKLDYSQWERCKRQNCGGLLLPSVRTPATYQKTAPLQKKGTGGISFPLAHREHKTRTAKYELSTTHDKSSVGPETRNSTELDVVSFKKHNTKPLKLLIELKKQMINELEIHCSSLLRTNCEMAEETENAKSDSFSCAQDCLIEHKGLGNFITNINYWHDSQIRKTEEDLTHAEDVCRNHLHELQEQLREVKAEVEKALTKLRFLKSFEKTAYPLNAWRIVDLERELENLKKAQKDEYEGVALLFKTEMVKLEKRSKQNEEELLAEIVEEKLSSIPPVLKATVAHNYKVRREVDLHKTVIKELEEENGALEKDLEHLRQLKRNAKKARSREMLHRTEKCSPDMDVTLDIPREDWLPI